MTSSAPPGRSFQFSVRKLFVLVTVFGVSLGWVGAWARTPTAE